MLQRFSTLEKLLGRHSLDIIKANPVKYQQCRQHMQLLLSANASPQEKTKKQLNMMFVVANLSDVYQPHRSTLFEFIQKGIIRSQDELDRVANWLAAEFRINNNLDQESIHSKIKSWSNTSEQGKEKLVAMLEGILERQGKEIDISDLSKRMRLTFPTLSSSDIYNEIRRRFNNNPARENKLIWDKLGGLKPRLLPYETNSADVWAQHQQVTRGKLRFRFPPEPNGYLHIGHCKSIRINFQTAKRTGGMCFLRFDDTNPDSQSHEFIDNILKEVRWMGYEPDEVTYASDYFEELMQMALKLVKEGKAYVCNASREQMHEERQNRQSNSERELPVEHSLKHFPELQPHQTLRLKLDPTAPNPTLRDPVIYRTKEKPHPRTLNRYRIYPTYDFTHCISDSIEHIDYSLCSLQFQIRRQLYYQILDMLRLYKPVVWEYSRLNIQGNLLSKRKIARLVSDKVVEGWDDPRLLTIAGLRNRGYTPTMLNSFIDRINVARAGNENVIQSNVLQLQMRKELNKTSERTMAVLQPVELTLTNLTEPVTIQVPLYPDQSKAGTRSVNLTSTIFVEESEDLPVSKQVNLKYFKRIRITKVTEVDGRKKLEAEILHETTDDGKKTVNIHWLSPQDSKSIEITDFLPLINNADEVNPINEKVYKRSIIHFDLSPSKTYQFERVGYFRFHKNRLICCCRLF